MTDDLLTLAAVFLRVGLLAFGGSTGVLAELEHQLVQDHHWLTPEQFANSFALGQLTPGPALVMVMFAGYRLAGTAGAVVALVSIFLPSAILMCIAIANWQLLLRSPWLNSARRGLAAVAFGLTAAGAYSIVRLAVTDVISVAVAVCAFGMLLRWHVPAALVILCGGLVAFTLGLLSQWFVTGYLALVGGDEFKAGNEDQDRLLVAHRRPGTASAAVWDGRAWQQPLAASYCLKRSSVPPNAAAPTASAPGPRNRESRAPISP